LNNKGWRNFKFEGEEVFGFKFDDPAIDYAALARSMGVFALRIELPQDINPALEKVKTMSAPALIDVVVDV
jgi:thiamine pyrophosphate-dependent acetolactate synthase large subunit-like protein